MRRLLILIMTVGLLTAGALPVLAQPSPVDEVAPIVVERPPARPALPVPPVDTAPAVGAPTGEGVTPARTVRVAAADQLARTGVDAATTAGAAALLLILGGALVLASRRSRLQPQL